MFGANEFIPRLNREIKPNQLVAVHFNTHQNLYSIVEMKSEKTTGVVLGYATKFTLENCYFKIDNSKKKIGMEKGHKERHAYVVGNITSFEFEELHNILYYNPKFLDSFIDIETKDNPIYLESVSKVSFDTVNEKPIVLFNY